MLLEITALWLGKKDFLREIRKLFRLQKPSQVSNTLIG